MKQRLSFKCWNCSRNYALSQEITSQQELIVPCPYCKAEAVVKLEPYRKDKKTVFKGGASEDQVLGYEYRFPAVIPTQKLP